MPGQVEVPMSRALTAHPLNAVTLDRGLKSYSLAAAAASVGMLALTQPASGEIIINHINKAVPVCARLDPCSLAIDLNNDGIADVKFQLLSTRQPTHYERSLAAFGSNGAEVVGTSEVPYAYCLLRGGKVGPSARFIAFGQMEASNGDPGVSRVLYGNWYGNHADRFLGVKFKIKHETHYGWVRVTVDSTPGAITATVTEYGYETIANKIVKVGLSGAAANTVDRKVAKPAASLGMLARGVESLALWRREQSSVGD